MKLGSSALQTYLSIAYAGCAHPRIHNLQMTLVRSVSYYMRNRHGSRRIGTHSFESRAVVGTAAVRMRTGRGASSEAEASVRMDRSWRRRRSFPLSLSNVPQVTRPSLDSQPTGRLSFSYNTGVADGNESGSSCRFNNESRTSLKW